MLPRAVIRITAQSGLCSPRRVQHVEAGALVQVNVGDDDGVGVALQALHGFAGGGHGFHGVSFQFQAR